MRERDIERYLVKRVKELGGEVRKVQWVGRRGAPDRLVMLPMRMRTVHIVGGSISVRPAPPKTLWVELKAPGKKPEPHQIREHARMRLMGQSVVVVDSIERVDEVLA